MVEKFAHEAGGKCIIDSVAFIKIPSKLLKSHSRATEEQEQDREVMKVRGEARDI